jgi:hypothetical protein
MARFVQRAQEHGQDKKLASYTLRKGILTISWSLPKDEKIVNGRRYKIKPKTKREQAVAKQISEHKQAKENGEETEGYVPPVGRTTPPKATKIKCPRCGIRKPVQKVNRMRILKPHQHRGEPCEGSGVQV